MMTTPKNALDHLVLFLPADPKTSLPILPSFLTSNFTITPGGTHADGLTSNSLILLADGCYIELICFLSGPSHPANTPEQFDRHWWGPATRCGWTDWCLTNALSPEKNWENVRESHDEPIAGARKRADGVEVKWSVTFPKGRNGGQAKRGLVPFFCHDRTKREVRVPVESNPESIQHSSGVLGVRRLTVLVATEERLDEMRKLYTSLFGSDGVSRGDKVIFEAGRVKTVGGLEGGARLTLRLAGSEVEREKVKGKGFWYGDVILAVKAKEGEEKGGKRRLDSEGNDVEGLWIEHV